MSDGKQTIAPRFRRALSYHAAAIYGMIGRLWLVLTGPVTIVFLAVYLTPDAQGYFLTFVTLAAARSVAELGLGQVIIVKIARLRPVGPEAAALNAPPIASLIRFTAKWFAGAGLIVGALLCIGGSALLGVGNGMSAAQWLKPWIALGCLVGFDVALSGLLYPLEGAGLVKSVSFCRMVRSILNSVVLWVCILVGFQLWSISIALIFSLIWTIIFICTRGQLVVTALHPATAVTNIDWSIEILPAQWRVALSSIAEYVSFYTVVPLVYVTQGPVIAGQVGVTWQMAIAISSIAGAVVLARFPEFSRLAGIRSIKALDNIFLSTSLISMTICFLGALSVGLGVLFLHVFDMSIAVRLLPFNEVAILMFGVLIWHINLPIVGYLRAHGGDPYLPASLIGAVLLFIGNITLGRWLGPMGFIVGYALIGACVMVPLGIYLFGRLRRACGYPQFELKQMMNSIISEIR